jgi:hypothetical protein
MCLGIEMREKGVRTMDRGLRTMDFCFKSMLYESLNSNPSFRGYFMRKGGDSAVVVFQHYSRGADEWLTLNWYDIIKFLPSAAYGLDEIPGDKAEEWLRKNLVSDDKRNEVPFPGVFVVYFAGLDHYAHEEGMSGYTRFFRETTDDEIKDLVDWLKKNNEFDNKIFIITSDHGHTGMAEFGPTTVTVGTKQITFTPDTSCKLKLEGFGDEETQYPEKYNNNLHIWELGNLLGVINQGQGLRDRGIVYKLLVPEEVATGYEEIPEAYRPTSDINEANVIAALNGPMAHVYLKGGDSWSNVPGEMELAKLAGVLQGILQTGGEQLDEDTRGKFSRLVSSVDIILIRINGKYKVFNGVRVDQNGNIIGANTTELNNYAGFNSSKYVDAVNRIKGMNNEKRSGDIVLLFKFDTDSSVSDRYTSGVSCKSWHGSLARSDSYVPFIVSYPGGNKYEIESILKSDEVCGSDYSLCKGNWKLPDVVKKIINMQYRQ